MGFLAKGENSGERKIDELDRIQLKRKVFSVFVAATKCHRHLSEEARTGFKIRSAVGQEKKYESGITHKDE